MRPRKAPTQQRAKATVERILDAGARVLIADGYEAASTNRIAAAAGVSPGSLYQYFPHKDAIVVAVVDRYADALADSMTRRLTGSLDAPPQRLVHTMLGALTDALAEQPEILRAVVEQLPRREYLGRLEAFEQRIADLLIGYLAMRRDTLRDADLRAAVWILVQVAEHLCVRYVLDRPPISRDTFVDELATLTLRYLAPAAR